MKLSFGYKNILRNHTGKVFIQVHSYFPVHKCQHTGKLDVVNVTSSLQTGEINIRFTYNRHEEGKWGNELECFIFLLLIMVDS